MYCQLQTFLKCKLQQKSFGLKPILSLDVVRVYLLPDFQVYKKIMPCQLNEDSAFKNQKDC